MDSGTRTATPPSPSVGQSKPRGSPTFEVRRVMGRVAAIPKGQGPRSCDFLGTQFSDFIWHQNYLEGLLTDCWAPHPEGIEFSRTGVRPENLHFKLVSGAAVLLLVGDSRFRATRGGVQCPHVQQWLSTLTACWKHLGSCNYINVSPGSSW